MIPLEEKDFKSKSVKKGSVFLVKYFGVHDGKIIAIPLRLRKKITCEQSQMNGWGCTLRLEATFTLFYLSISFVTA